MSHRTGVSLFKVGMGQARKTKHVMQDSSRELILSVNLETEAIHVSDPSVTPHVHITKS